MEIPVEYLGFAAMDRRLSSPMMPWIIAEIKMRGMKEKMALSICDGFIKGHSAGESDPTHLSTANSEPLFKHSLSQIKKYSHMFGSHCNFLYFLRDPMEPNLLFCYLYQTEDPQDVSLLKNF
ncbi:hypothetical protein ONE63_003674 [Megalurothrips usitatus]|uniref:Uncharacterized protein n=1 Tax=Megalurothrips usitatus TaxID=439358 RepID=A0AAV7X793_9NEOP|nr:hypothetical protein ONE63_003674 [Megalurothrips usitatus]